jgi:hypothetical protein
MPFPDGSQEAPRLFVARPEFRQNPLNGRTAPMTAVRSNGHAHRKRTWPPDPLGYGW